MLSVVLFLTQIVNSHLHCLSDCMFVDALLWTGVEPRSGDPASPGLRGRQNACHSDVGLALCYLAS